MEHTQECYKCKEQCLVTAFYNGLCFKCHVKELEAEVKPLRAFARYMDDCIVNTANAGFVLANTCAELIKLKVDKALENPNEN